MKRNVYDANGRITRTTRYATELSAATLTTLASTDAPSSVSPTTNAARDQVTTYVYDTVGRLSSETQDPAGLNLVTGYKYDVNGRLTRKIDARGNSTWYVYDNALLTLARLPLLLLLLLLLTCLTRLMLIRTPTHVHCEYCKILLT